MSEWPIRPDEKTYPLLADDGPEAVEWLKLAWAEIDRLREHHTRLLEDDAEARAELAITALTDSFTPRGHFVYILYGKDGAVLYIGRSSNVFRRLADHMDDPSRSGVQRVALIRCPEYTDSMRLEMEMIGYHQPPLNKVGIRRAS